METLNIVGPMERPILPVVIFAGALWILLALLLGGRGSIRPAPVAKPFMTGREEAMLIVLEEIFPMYRFHVQVAMGALLKLPHQSGAG